MTYLGLALLVGFPLVAGAVATALPRRLAHVVAAAAMVAVAAGVAVTRPDTPLRVGETELALTQITRLELSYLAALGVALVAYHLVAGRTAPLPALLPLLMAAIASGCVFSSDLLVAASFLQLAALIASLLMIAEQPDWQSSVAGAIYLVLSALGGMALLFGFVLADIQRLSPGGLVTVPFVVAALSVGLALQWGVAPLHAWLPNAFQRAGPASIALAVSFVGPATLGLLLQALSALPQLVVDERVNRYLTYGGLFTAVFGALAAIAPQRLRRSLGYIMVADIAFVLVGMSTYTRIGVTGAVLHVAHRSLVALVLVAAASEFERQEYGPDEGRRPAPYLWGTLVLAALTLVGVPPFSGFAANWAVYQALSLLDLHLALGLAFATAVSLVAALAAAGRVRRSYPRPWRRPLPVEVLLMGLCALAALWGLAPGPALGTIHRAVSQLPFLKPF